MHYSIAWYDCRWYSSDFDYLLLNHLIIIVVWTWCPFLSCFFYQGTLDFFFHWRRFSLLNVNLHVFLFLTLQFLAIFLQPMTHPWLTCPDFVSFLPTLSFKATVRSLWFSAFFRVWKTALLLTFNAFFQFTAWALILILLAFPFSASF